MDRIIVLPGRMNSLFFLNEVDYIKKHFDEIIVISYPGNKEKFLNISREKGFRYHVVNLNLFLSLFDINFYKWFFEKNTKKEVKSIFSLSKQGLLKFGYILHYGLFYINAKKIIDKELVLINKDDNVFFYSFWFSRGAYTIANYNTGKYNNVKKIISRVHGYDLYEDRNKINYLPFRKFIDNNLDEIHFVSEQGLKYFTNKYKINRLSSEKYVSRLGTFNNDKIIKNISIKRKICIASCSSIIPIKRLDLIIDVISKINISVEWIHIGTGRQINKMKSYAEQKLKEKSFQFLGQIDNSEILKTYKKFDVDYFINMSDSEGVPVSIMEAMSMGIPVIARDVGGVNEIVSQETGLLIKDISNMNLVINLVNEEIEQRCYKIDIYEAKHKKSIEMWNEKYNADKNYNDFFSRLVRVKTYRD